jgi:hypothetical protein
MSTANASATNPRIANILRIIIVAQSSPGRQHERSLRAAEGGESGIMSTIEEVRAAEKKVQEILDALKKAGPQDPHHLRTELKNATDEYARAVRELNSK